MTSKSDPEVKKAIEAHRQKTITSQQQMNILSVQLENLSTKRRRSELIEKELKSLPLETTTYRASGRMFLKTPIPSLIENIGVDRSRITLAMEALEKNRDSIIESLNESKDSLKELLNSKQQMQAT